MGARARPGLAGRRCLYDMRRDEHRQERAHRAQSTEHRHRHKYIQAAPSLVGIHSTYIRRAACRPNYSVDYCGTARNKKITHEYLVRCGTVGTVQGKQRVGDQDKDVGRQDGPSTHMDGPPRHGTESVPSRLRLSGCWSLLAAEPAVHEDHTRRLSQIPHHFWFWAPTDTRFGGPREGRLGLLYPVQGMCVCAVRGVLCMYMCAHCTE